MEFEREVVGLLSQGRLHFAIDFSGTELITSAGIRVLMLLAQRTRKNGGGTVLFGLSDHVTSVLEVAGLSAQFQVVDTETAAMARLKTGSAGRAATPASTLTRLSRRLVASPGSRTAAPAGAEPSALTRTVAAIMTSLSSGRDESSG